MPGVTQRSLALDVFRGLAIAGMILVNTPGSWSAVYPPLLHASWHGCTPTDLVFPFFLFATGAGMFFSFARSNFRPSAGVLFGVARRSALLVLIGILLNAYPFTEPLGEWRLPGVLQRIGLAYGLAALLVLYCPGKWRLALCVIILLAYWALLVAFGGSDPFAVESNLVRQVDIAVLGEAHLWEGFGLRFDPEGLLSTLPAVVSVLAGFEAARLLQAGPRRGRAVLILLLGGACAVALALVWNAVLPINKPLWTSSYVLFTSGISWMVLALLVLLLDVLGLRWLGRALEIYGTNPLFIYILSSLQAKTLWLITVDDGQGNGISLYTWLYERLLPFLSPENASLLFAVLHVLFFWLLSWALYRRGIIIKL